MIPRAAKRLETTLLLSRQSLPRPARLYSTPSQRASAPAAATQQVLHPSYQFLPSGPSKSAENEAHHKFPTEMATFLHSPPRYTVLPTPIPNTSPSSKNSTWLTDSATQDALAVMDACLYQQFDVPRAKGIFDRLRRAGVATHELDARMYNAFLEAYLNMAGNKSGDERLFWLECAWELFRDMEDPQAIVAPSAGTYATMLLTWLR